jgi:GH35 family endo-1,4-beta-xylanase
MSDRNSPSKIIQATLKITRSDRTPVQNQDVILAQKGHKFLFGTAAFDLLPLTNGEYSGADLEKAEERANKMLAICNAATLPFYWGTFEPERGKPITAKMKNAATWAKTHGMTVKGHPLCWHTLTADWLLKLSNAEILDAQIARIQRDVAEFNGMIDMWDVINEAVIMPIFDKYDNGITRLCKEKGRIETIKAMFETTHAVNPGATLLINDFETSVAYDILVEGCLAAGIKFDVIGIQSHMHQGYWGVEKTMEILERFSRFNLPIHFTETTIISGQLMSPEIVDLNDYQVKEWPSTPEGEERQAMEVATHYKTLFNHPLVEGITWWDLSDGQWLNAPAGLLRKDGSSKPAYEELLKLIKGEWWVPPTRLTTDEKGCIHFSGYPGKYELTYGDNSNTFDLNQPNQVIEVY